MVTTISYAQIGEEIQGCSNCSIHLDNVKKYRDRAAELLVVTIDESNRALLLQKHVDSLEIIITEYPDPSAGGLEPPIAYTEKIKEYEEQIIKKNDELGLIEKELSDKTKEVTQLSKQRTKDSTEIISLRVEREDKNGLSERFSDQLTIANDKLGIIEDSLVAQASRVKSLSDSNDRLMSDVKYLSDEIIAEQVENKELSDSLALLHVIVSNMENKLDSLKFVIKVMETEIDRLSLIVDCMHDFDNRRILLSAEADTKIGEAREIYSYLFEEYRYKEIPKELLPELKRAVGIYKQYEISSLDDVVCDGVDLSTTWNNLTGKDHFYLARIFAYNQANIINDLPASSAQDKINRAAQLILSHLGYAIGNTEFYDDISDNNAMKVDLLEMLKSIDFLVVTSRNNSMVKKLEKINEHYLNGRYVEALITYNLYERFIDLDELVDEKDVLDQMKFIVYSLTLWEMIDIKSLATYAPKNSWLGKLKNDPKGKSRMELGKILLRKDLDIELRKQVTIVLHKTYNRA